MNASDLYLEQVEVWGKWTRRVEWLQAVFIPTVGCIAFLTESKWLPVAVVVAGLIAVDLWSALAHKAASASACAILRGLSGQ